MSFGPIIFVILALNALEQIFRWITVWVRQRDGLDQDLAGMEYHCEEREHDV